MWFELTKSSLPQDFHGQCCWENEERLGKQREKSVGSSKQIVRGKSHAESNLESEPREMPILKCNRDLINH